jgi:hypothetical protein
MTYTEKTTRDSPIPSIPPTPHPGLADSPPRPGDDPPDPAAIRPIFSLAEIMATL